MSQENVEVVRRSLDAFSQRDVDTMRALNDPNLVLDWSASGGVARRRVPRVRRRHAVL
jgi:ketosteroid isomerase-like protein